MEPKADRPRGPRLENSDKSDLPGIQNEGVDGPALRLTQQDAARAQSTDKWAWSSAFAQWLLSWDLVGNHLTRQNIIPSSDGVTVSTSLI